MSEITINEPNLEISPDLKEVIEKLPPQVPADFKKRAETAAKYISELDSGKIAGDGGRERFKDQLASTGFILSVFIHYRSQKIFEGAPDPGEALPKWLYEEAKSRMGSEETADVEQKFQQWVSQKGFKTSEWGGDIYYKVGSSDSAVPLPRTFKCYVEGDCLKEGLESGSIQAVIDELQAQSIGPRKMKLFEGDRLVLYFSRDVGLSDKIRGAFETQGLDFRGPAQDVLKLQAEENGDLTIEPVTSNDGSLGEGGHSPVQYQLKKYNAPEFFDNYLQLCLWAGKAPDEPYKTSFVWMIDPEGRVNAGFETEAREIAGYPILCAKGKFDIIDRKWTSL